MFEKIKNEQVELGKKVHIFGASQLGKKLFDELKIHDICVDTLSRKVTKSGELINLTHKEYDILLLFLQNKNIALFRERIYETILSSKPHFFLTL